MSLIEYIEIGNIIGEESSWVKEVALGVGGILFGVGISEWLTWRRSSRHRKKNCKAIRFSLRHNKKNAESKY